MSHIKHINKLYEEYGDAQNRRDDSLQAMQEIYNIPQEVIDRYVATEENCTTAWHRYWNSLSTPWWLIVWTKLTARKKY